MKTSFFTLFLALATNILAIPVENAQTSDLPENHKVPGRFIVEIDTDHASAEEHFSHGDIDVTINGRFDSPIFKGLSVTVAKETANTLDEIKKVPGVINAWCSYFHSLNRKDQKSEEQWNPETITDSEAQDEGLENTLKREADEDQDEELDNTLKIEEDESSENSLSEWNPHMVTGVQALKDRGISGEGVVVGVINSGADYNHESLKGKLLPGYNFVDGIDTPSRDAQDHIGQGTEACSVIVGDSEKLPGVAPAAKIVPYKVVSNTGDTSDELIIAALLKAHSDKVSVITVGIANDWGYQQLPLTIVANRVAREVPVIFAAGDSGKDGLYNSKAGAVCDNCIAVGSCDATQVVSWNAEFKSSNGETFEFNYVSNFGNRLSLDKAYSVKYVEDMFELESCPKNEETFILAREKLLVELVACATIDKEYFGAFVVLPGESHRYMAKTIKGLKSTDDNSESRLTDLLMLIDSGPHRWAKEQISRGNKVTVGFKNTVMRVNPNNSPTSGQISPFSSWGPDFSQGLYPHIAAPGGFVLVAQLGGGYKIESGTTLAASYIAGVVALYLSSADTTADATTIRNNLISSGKLKPVVLNHGTNILSGRERAPLIKQGNGLVDAVSFLDSVTRITSSPYLNLNDTRYRVSEHTITFKNTGTSSVDYTVSHRNAEGVLVKHEPEWTDDSYPRMLFRDAAEMQISRTSLTLAPGELGSVTVNITPPRGTSQDLVLLFNGVVEISGSNGDVLAVPYMGIQVDSYNWMPFAEKPKFYRKNEELTSKSGPLLFCPKKSVFLQIDHEMSFGTVEYSFDLVSADYDLKDFKFPLVAGENGYFGPIRYKSRKSPDQIVFPLRFANTDTQKLFRGRNQFTKYRIPVSSFADGSDIPTGSYKILSRALRTFGRYSDPKDWQLYLSSKFRFKDGSSH